jgi:hypothetical protein
LFGQTNRKPFPRNLDRSREIAIFFWTSSSRKEKLPARCVALGKFVFLFSILERESAMKSYRVLTLCAPLLLGALLIGCNTEAPSSAVTGSVNFDGKPLSSGAVTFWGPDGKANYAGQVKEGKYKVDKAPLGKCKVTVTYVPPAGDAGDPTKKNTDNKIIPIPEKYKAQGTTDLTYEVKTGPNNTYDIDLKK